MRSKEEPEPAPREPKAGVSRRGFIRGVGISGAVGAGVLEADAQGPAQRPSAKVIGPGPVPITLRVNGKPFPVTVEPRATLLDTLRDRLNLTGAKRVCDRGACGSCTVLMGGKAVYACNILAVEAQGKEIQTIEGLTADARPHPIVKAFVENDAQQCGYCTTGFVMTSKALLDKNPSPTFEQVEEGLAGNLCRCGTYMGLRRAVLQAAKEMKGGSHA